MSKKIIWSPLSVKDFEQILDYLNLNWNQQVVTDFITLTDHIIIHISGNPRQFPIINKLKKIRKCVITKHNILFYRESIEGIHI